MASVFKKSFLFFCFLLTSYLFVFASDVNEHASKLKSIAQELTDKSTYNQRIASFLKTSFDGSEEDLIEMCNVMLVYRKTLGSKVKDVEQVRDALITDLRGFVASGMDVQIDPNFAFIYNAQNPNFTVTFQNPEGRIKTRTYSLNVRSVGLKFEFAVKLDGIFILGSDFNYYDSIDKEYELGAGFDLGYYLVRYAERRKVCGGDGPIAVFNHFSNMVDHGRFLEYCAEAFFCEPPIGLCCTTSKIKGTLSSIVILGVAIGFGGSFTTTGLEGGFVLGGKMTPLVQNEM